MYVYFCFFFFSSRRRHTRFDCDWSSDVCSSDLAEISDTAPPASLPAAANILVGRSSVIDADTLEIHGTRIRDRKSTRLNSSHSQISYAVFCLKKKKTQFYTPQLQLVPFSVKLLL